MSYRQKKTNVSSRSKRRRGEEELRYNCPISLKKIGTSTDLHESNVSPDLNSLLNTHASFSQNLNSVTNLVTIPETTFVIDNFPNQDEFIIIHDTEEVESRYSCSSSSSEDNDNDDSNSVWDESCKGVSYFSSSIALWAVTCNVPQSTVNKLLVILRQHKCFENLSKGSRTILSTKWSSTLVARNIEPGIYYHFGIQNSFQQNVQNNLENITNIRIVVNVDGLPIFKSSPDQLWPILAYIRPKSDVFPIGLYCGKEKPNNSNNFLKEFVDEAKLLIENGISINNKIYGFSVDTFCCDSPAKSFLLNIKGHSGYFSCSMCEQEGEYKHNRICFPYTSGLFVPSLRTHQNYISQSQEDHHVGDPSILIQLPSFNIVESFSLDYMHLVCLGVVRKLILLWMKGDSKGSNEYRYPSWKIKEISNSLEKIKSNIPCEFSRKPRRLVDGKRLSFVCFYFTLEL